MADQGVLLAAVINQGFDWVQARGAFRRVNDSKRATEADRQKAAKRAIDAGNKLELTFVELMQISNGTVGRKKTTRTALPVDWSKVVGAIAKGAGALESVLNTKKGPVVEVIDTEGKEI